MSNGPFRKCHLQILRSLYDGAAAPECRSGGKEPSDGDDDATDKKIEGAGAPDGVNGDAAASEGPVDGETWDLIAQFLRRRADYRPHKERQLHWSNISAAAQSRLDHLLSIASADEDAKTITQRSSLTPRTPSMFSVSGRGARSPTLSLTPLSSNRNAPKLSQSEREAASTIPSWKFINSMLQRRSRICTQSCEEYRSQPFLAEVREEAEMRCKVLGRAVTQLKARRSGAQKDNDKKREGSTLLAAEGKRQKVNAVQPAIPSSLGEHLPRNIISEPAGAALDADESGGSDDLIMETQMKLCLWSSLLSSVKDIVDEK